MTKILITVFLFVRQRRSVCSTFVQHGTLIWEGGARKTTAYKGKRPLIKQHFYKVVTYF
jgi:hypothetical protein